MVTGTDKNEPSNRERDLAAELRLRPERPTVMRLSRRVLMGLAAVAVITVFSALMWAFNQAQKKPSGGTELYNTENKPTPEGLTSLPRDYAGLPRTGPPPTGVHNSGRHCRAISAGRSGMLN